MIAIISDDEAVRIATASLVRSLGLAARSFASTEDFLGSSDIVEIACVISDVQMPSMSGPALLRHLLSRGNRTPMIFITAYPEERIRTEAASAGAFGFLPKPFDGEATVACIERALRAG